MLLFKVALWLNLALAPPLTPWTMIFLFIDFSHGSAYVGQLFNGFYPI